METATSTGSRVNIFLIVGGLVGSFVFAVLRALLVDETRGRVQRRVEASVEATIASLPAHLQAEWADEWRAELAATNSMPFTAARFARGLRHTANQLIEQRACSPIYAANRVSPDGRRNGLQRVWLVVPQLIVLFRDEPNRLADSFLHVCLVAAPIVRRVFIVIGLFEALAIFFGLSTIWNIVSSLGGIVLTLLLESLIRFILRHPARSR